MNHTAAQQEEIRRICATKGKKAALEYIRNINTAEVHAEEKESDGKALAAAIERKTVYQAAIDKLQNDVATILGDFDESAVDANGFPAQHPSAAIVRKLRYEQAQIKASLETVKKSIATLMA